MQRTILAAAVLLISISPFFTRAVLLCFASPCGLICIIHFSFAAAAAAVCPFAYWHAKKEKKWTVDREGRKSWKKSRTVPCLTMARVFRKCKSATFQIGNDTYTIGKSDGCGLASQRKKRRWRRAGLVFSPLYRSFKCSPSLPPPFSIEE